MNSYWNVSWILFFLPGRQSCCVWFTLQIKIKIFFLFCDWSRFSVRIPLWECLLISCWMCKGWGVERERERERDSSRSSWLACWLAGSSRINSNAFIVCSSLTTNSSNKEKEEQERWLFFLLRVNPLIPFIPFNANFSSSLERGFNPFCIRNQFGSFSTYGRRRRGISTRPSLPPSLCLSVCLKCCLYLNSGNKQ